jgi:hypothetical protein
MGTPYKMKGSPMQRNFGIGSPMKNEKKDEQRAKDLANKNDITSKTSPGEGYKKIKGTNTWEHTATKNNKEINLRDTQLIAESAGYKGRHPLP